MASTEKYYYLYQITNLITGHFYIGKRVCPVAHCRVPEEDKYFGSGTVLATAIRRYGSHSFRKDILCFTSTLALLNKLEELVVDEHHIRRGDTYNAKVGGVGGGLGRPRGVVFSEEHKANLRLAKKTRRSVRLAELGGNEQTQRVCSRCKKPVNVTDFSPSENRCRICCATRTSLWRQKQEIV